MKPVALEHGILPRRLLKRIHHSGAWTAIGGAGAGAPPIQTAEAKR